MLRSPFLSLVGGLVVAWFSSELALSAPPASVSVVDPESLGFDTARLALIDELVNEGLSQSKMPGAVVVV